MRISSIDFFRVIAIFAIILNHTSPFGGSNNIFFETLYIVISQSTRFAVPFFLTVAGYFYGNKLLTGTLPIIAFKTYFRRLFPIFLIWSFIYMILPTNIKKQVLQSGLWEASYQKITTLLSDPVTLLFEGSRGHLWFLISLLISLGIITLLIKYDKKHIIIPLALALYFFGLIGGSYAQTPFGLDISFNTRNGPFFSTLFVAVGWYFSYTKHVIKPLHALSILLLGVFMHVLEVSMLWKLYSVPPLRHDYLLGTLFCGVGLTLFLLSQPNLFINSRITMWAKYTLGIYVSHMLIIDILTPFERIIPFPLWDIFYPLVIFFLSLYLVYILSKFRILKHTVAY